MVCRLQPGDPFGDLRLTGIREAKSQAILESGGRRKRRPRNEEDAFVHGDGQKLIGVDAWQLQPDKEAARRPAPFDAGFLAKSSLELVGAVQSPKVVLSAKPVTIDAQGSHTWEVPYYIGAKGFRWLHEGLHRFDVVPGFRRGPVWAGVTLALLAAVTFGVGTGVWLGWRRIGHDLSQLRNLNRKT